MAETEPKQWFYWTSEQDNQVDMPAGIVLATTPSEAFMALKRAAIEGSRFSLADQEATQTD